jgi:hypothetical protein
MSAFVPFWYESNQWFKAVRDEETFFDLLRYHDVDQVLDAKMAPMTEIVGELPDNYYAFGEEAAVRDGLPSFGYRREHLRGVVRLEDWARTRGMDLRAIAARMASA